MDAVEYRALVAATPDPECGAWTRVGIATGECEGCGGCCGRVLQATARERARLLDHVRRHRVRPVATRHQMCALLDPETRRCMAYAARPLVCRVWDSPTRAEVALTRPGQPCGCRRDMLAMVMRQAQDMDDTDTWELFGVSLDEGEGDGE